MSKWFEVKMVTVTIMLIEVDSKPMFGMSAEDCARDIAYEDAPMTGKSEAEEINPIADEYVANCRRHADIVRSISGEGDKG